ncbi:MAG: hypothetical protein WB511_00905 [Nitrososphaeraceae archaeon]
MKADMKAQELAGENRSPPPDAITDDVLFYEQQTIKRLRPVALSNF